MLNQMFKTNVDKLMDVWKTGNKIEHPNKRKICFDVIDQITSLFSFGPFYYYIFNLETLKMEYISKGTREVLKIEPEHYSLQKGFEIIHPEDLASLSNRKQSLLKCLMNKITDKEKLLYKVMYKFRFKHISGAYKPILHQAKKLSVNKDGKIHYTVGIHTDVTHTLREGENQLEIEVANRWINRLPGDKSEHEEYTRTIKFKNGLMGGKKYSVRRYTFTTAQAMRSFRFIKPLSSGLLGPVTIQITKNTQL